MKKKPATEEKIVTAYVTRYAVSAGVMRVRGRYREGEPKPMLSYRHPGSSYDIYVSHKDWHLTEAAALADVEKRLKRKLASLVKQVTTIEKMLSNIPTIDQTGGHP